MKISLGEAVVYKSKGIYKVEDVGNLNFMFADKNKKYYTLQSIEDSKDRAYVPAEDEVNIRKPVSKSEALDLIHDADNIDEVWVKNGKIREQEYKECISNNDPKEWMKVLKTLYMRSKSMGSLTTIDKKYQQLIEHALYSELCYVLGTSVSKVEELIRE